LSNSRISIDVQQWTDPALLRKMDEPANQELMHMAFQYTAKEHMENYRWAVTSDDHEYDSNGFTVFDGKYHMDYFTTNNSHDTQTRKARATLDKPQSFPPIRYQRWHTPLRMLGYEENTPLEDILAASDTIVRPEMEDVNGISCYRIDAQAKINRVTYHLSYWLSPERSFLPAKLEITDKTGHLVRRVDVTDFMQLSNGQWFPKQTVHSSFAENTSGKTWMNQKATYTLKSIQLNPFVDETQLFNTSINVLPVGTLFQDHLAGIEYVMGEGPVSEETIQDIIDRAITETPLASQAAGKGNEHPEDSSKKTIGEHRKNSSLTKTLFSDRGALASAKETGTTDSKPVNKTILAICGLITIAITAAIAVLKARTKKGNAGK